MSINLNFRNIRRCCICEVMAPENKCVNCNLRYCKHCDDDIFFHKSDDSNHRNTILNYFKCCNSCCSNCYTESCIICGILDNNLDMIVVHGNYQCKDHID
jgi:hypothetical protein